MSRFIVRFMKNVLGTNGHEAQICQGYVEVDAPDESDAAEMAKKSFCEGEDLDNWTVHADRIEIKPADFLS